MPRFICLTTFLDGRERFTKGEVRDHEKAAYFIEQGWASPDDGEAPPDAPMVDAPPATLDIHDVIHDQGDSNG